MKNLELQSLIVANQIKAMAILAEIEAMKAENQNRISLERSLAYVERDFVDCSFRLNKLAEVIQNFKHA